MRASIQYSIDTLCQNFVEGWALGPSGPCQIEVVVDGRAVGTAVGGLRRGDVAAALPQIPNSEASGFIYAFTPGDWAGAGRDASVSLQITAGGSTVLTDPVRVPAPTAHEFDGELPRSGFPAAVTRMLVRRAPELASVDLSAADGARAAVEVLEFLVRRGPRPQGALHRYLHYLRLADTSAMFAARHFPRANVRSTGDKDTTGQLTNPLELAMIAHHLYVTAEAGIPGVVVEFGCYKGYSTSVLSTVCQLLGRQLHVFDSFQGLPQSSSTFYRAGEFAGDFEEVRANVSAFGRDEVVTFHRGFFCESVPRWTAQPIACMWMDVDLEQSAIDALRVMPHLDVRGALFSHECGPAAFSGTEPIPHRGADEVVGPIVDAFGRAGRTAAGRFLHGHTGAFWDRDRGWPVLPSEAFERVLQLARQ